MKHLLIITLLILFVSCSERQATTRKQTKTKETNLVSDKTENQSVPKINSTEENKSDTYYSINVVFRNTYCGGAWAPQEIIDEYEQELPLKNSTILLKELGGNRKSLKATTDNHGLIHMILDPGTYQYFMTKSYKETLGADFNPTDSASLYQCYGKITLTENKSKAYSIVFPFNNCGQGNRP